MSSSVALLEGGVVPTPVGVNQLARFCRVRHCPVVPTPVGVNRVATPPLRGKPLVVPTPVGVNRMQSTPPYPGASLSPHPWG